MSFVSHIFMISCWLHCRKMTLHVKPTGGWYTWPEAVLLIWYVQSRFSSLPAEHKCIFFSFVAMPLSFWDITWYSLQWASVCLFLIHRPPRHRNIFNCIFYSPIYHAKLRTLQEGKWVSQSRLAMNRGNKAHWWIESKVQNERKAFGYHGACGTSHLLIPKAAAAAVRWCLLGVGDPPCLWANTGIGFTLPISISWLSLAAKLESNPGILTPKPLLSLLPN